MIGAASESVPIATIAVEGRMLCRRYGARWALANVDLDAACGSTLLVAGRNGSGKTTLFRILATAIHASKGTARVAGFDVARQRRQARRRVTLLSHQTYLYEPLTAYENLDVSARAAGMTRSRGELLSLLERVALVDRAHDFVAEFSAGMRKRLALARALLRPTPVVLLDEPYGQLDPEGFELVDQIVAECRGRGATILLATHQLDRGRRLCQEAMLLDHGRCLWRGRAADLPLFHGSGVAEEEGSQ